MQNLNSLFLDLDGTLADTAPDLLGALNNLLLENNLPTVNMECSKPWISEGAAYMIERTFTRSEDQSRQQNLVNRLLQLYEQQVCVKTKLFPGMKDLLEYCERNRIKWGIVTNKRASLTTPIVASLGLLKRAQCIVSGDTTANRKPHPQPLLLACQISQTLPRRCLYIGDSKNDVIAARRAGMKSLLALYGYIDTDDNPECWGADAVVEAPEEIIKFINKWYK